MPARSPLLRVLTLCYLLLLIVGCTNSTAVGPSKSKGTVGVSVLTMTNPFFRVIGDNLTAELEKAGYEAVVVAGELDVAKQNQQVRDFLTQGCAAIVLWHVLMR